MKECKVVAVSALSDKELRKMMGKKHLFAQKYFRFEDHVDLTCDHEGCECYTSWLGNHPSNYGFRFDVLERDGEMGRKNFIEEYRRMYPALGFSHFRPQEAHEMTYFQSRLLKGSNIRLIEPQTPCVSIPKSVLEPDFGVVRRIARMADMLYWNSKGVLMGATQFNEHVWRDNPQPSLMGAVVGKGSIYNMAFGKINGRNKYTLSATNLYPRKWANALLLQQRNVAQAVPRNEDVMRHMERAMDMFYYKLGVDHLKGKSIFPITFEAVQDAYMGSSAGLHDFKAQSTEVNGTKICIDASKKKIENFDKDMATLIQFLTRERTDPANYWEIKEKVEMFFSKEHQKNTESYLNWINKVRIFVIPTSLFVMMERMVSKPRMFHERRGFIRIGGKWSRGGADILARMLGIFSSNEWKKILVEGDVKNFDQSTIAKMVHAYFSKTLYYEMEDTVPHELRTLMVEWITKNIITRITHMIGQLWAIQQGGVPSGCFNTSHMDSWIMGMYFFLFAYEQISRAPLHERDKLEDALIRLIFLIVYGDDHAWNKSEDEMVAYWFSGKEFQNFMKVFFDVDVREMKDGLAFLSKVDGWGSITELGLTFLKYQFVKNLEKGKDQPRYLPFRETWEFVIRALIGGKGEERSVVDVVLSVLGHAYGTYASNRAAYDALFCIYKACFQILGQGAEEKIKEMLEALPYDDLRAMRRKGITPQELFAGFPTWQVLVNKNAFDEAYHTPTFNLLDVNKSDLDF